MAAKAGSRGSELADRLAQGIQEAERAPLPGARQLPMLHSLTRRGEFTQPQENVLAQAADLLAQSGRVYVYGDAVMMEIGRLDAGGARLVPLRTGLGVEGGAEDWLSNLLLCQDNGAQFPLPRWFVDVLLRCEPALARLPRILLYALRPVFDEGFALQGPGWHPQVGILVHAPDVEPVLHEPGPADGPALDRLPPHLRALLGGFCFRTDADLANTVGVLLTGMLVNHFITPGKAVVLVDGNQSNLGKTWLIRAVGIVLDGIDPRLIPYTADDEELQKKICARLRESRQSVLIIDNAKVVSGSTVTSPVIEANSMAPEVSIRILGVSENYTRPNDLLWALTMNDTRTSPDLVSRGLPIQLFYEGRTEDRTFAGPDPLEYAREHRLEILGELAGMVVRWNQQGRPDGQRAHRCHYWARVIGGALETAGLPEFLANAGTAAATFNTALDELAALAEAVIAAGGPHTVGDTPNGEDN